MTLFSRMMLKQWNAKAETSKVAEPALTAKIQPLLDGVFRQENGIAPKVILDESGRVGILLIEKTPFLQIDKGLANKISEKEMDFIIHHEFAHVLLNHPAIRKTMRMAATFINLGAATAVMILAETPILPKIAMVIGVNRIAALFTSPIYNLMNRMAEFAADRYAIIHVKTADGLRSTLRADFIRESAAMAIKNAIFPKFIKSMMLYTHKVVFGYAEFLQMPAISRLGGNLLYLVYSAHPKISDRIKAGGKIETSLNADNSSAQDVV